MAGKVPFPCRWEEMPNPHSRDGAGSTTIIEVGEPEWRKIVQKHFANSKEPWAAAIAQIAMKNSSSEDENAAVAAALDAVRDECVSTLRKPLIILYSCVGRQIRGQGHRWVFVLPSGALAVVWREKEVHRLKTCYFTGAVAVKPRETRWRHALRQQVQEYAVLDEQSNRFRYPRPNDRREVNVVQGHPRCDMRSVFSRQKPGASHRAKPERNGNRQFGIGQTEKSASAAEAVTSRGRELQR